MEMANIRPHRFKPPDLIEIKFGTVDYVGETTPAAKFHANPSMWNLLADVWNTSKK